VSARLVAGGLVGLAAAGAIVVRRIVARRAGASQLSAPDDRRAADARGTITPVQEAIPQGRAMSTTTPLSADAAHPRPVRRWLLTIPPIALLALMALTFVLRGDYRIAATLGIVQGLGEPLPISSSAHLILTPWFFGWNNIPNSFFDTQWYDVALHVGTLLAFVVFFWQDWLRLLIAAPRPRTDDGRLFWLIVLASLPGAAIGFVLDRYADDFFRERYLIIATTLAVMGVALYWIDRVAPRNVELSGITWRSALLVGLSQALAFIPGVSRSGSTITMGRAMGLTRETAARFSFLMGMPITFGAVLLKARDVTPGALASAPFWIGIGMSFLVGVLAIGFLLRYVKSNSYLPFALYRLALAAAVVIVYVLRG
jgi:undecaprenyl-diphosphatase